MEVVEGKILNVKPKQTRDGTSYQGVTLEGMSGAKFWFGNYSETVFNRGERIRVTAESTADGNNITFLNKVKSVERVSPAGTRTTSVSSAPPTDTGALTGWEDEEIGSPLQPATAKPEPSETANLNVTENPAPLGTLDDLAEGTDPSCYGGAITFKKGSTKTEIEFLLRALMGVLETCDIREYDEKDGSPVFYIP